MVTYARDECKYGLEQHNRIYIIVEKVFFYTFKLKK